MGKKIYGEDKEIGMLAIPFVKPGYSAEDVNRWAIGQVESKKDYEQNYLLHLRWILLTSKTNS